MGLKVRPTIFNNSSQYSLQKYGPIPVALAGQRVSLLDGKNLFFLMGMARICLLKRKVSNVLAAVSRMRASASSAAELLVGP